MSSCCQSMCPGMTTCSPGMERHWRGRRGRRGEEGEEGVGGGRGGRRGEGEGGQTGRSCHQWSRDTCYSSESDPKWSIFRSTRDYETDVVSFSCLLWFGADVQRAFNFTADRKYFTASQGLHGIKQWCLKVLYTTHLNDHSFVYNLHVHCTCI